MSPSLVFRGVKGSMHYTHARGRSVRGGTRVAVPEVRAAGWQESEHTGPTATRPQPDIRPAAGSKAAAAGISFAPIPPGRGRPAPVRLRRPDTFTPGTPSKVFPHPTEAGAIMAPGRTTA